MKSLMSAALVLGMLVTPFEAQAAGRGNPTHLAGHPRVNQVNHRVADQHARIAQGVKNGTISTAQAKQLGQERHSIKQEEHTMRASDGGHLTSADKTALNQQLNARSAQIYGEKH